MELPKFKKSEGGMLDGLKSKLGFSDAPSGRSRRGEDYGEYDGEYGDEYGEGYDDLAEYGPEYEEGDAAGSRYDPYAPVTTRLPRSTRSSRGGGADFPKLVSIDDVRAHTQVPDSLKRDPLPPRRTSSASTGAPYRAERTTVDVTQPAPSSPAYVAAEAERAARQELRSEGLESLFSPTSSPASAKEGVSGSVASSAAPAHAAPAKARSLSVLKPSSYDEAEQVAKALKAGDAVIIALRNTPDHLAKRILDFSFGVSSALDAQVECIADKVFAITRGAAVSDAERLALRNQGVL